MVNGVQIGAPSVRRRGPRPATDCRRPGHRRVPSPSASATGSRSPRSSASSSWPTLPCPPRPGDGNGPPAAAQCPPSHPLDPSRPSAGGRRFRRRSGVTVEAANVGCAGFPNLLRIVRGNVTSPSGRCQRRGVHSWCCDGPVSLLAVVAVTVAGGTLGAGVARQLWAGRYRLPGEVCRLSLRGCWSAAAAVAVAWGALPATSTAPALLPAVLLFTLAGAVVAWIDLDVHRIPNRVLLATAPLVAGAGWVADAVVGQWWRVGTSLAAAAALLLF